MCRLAELKRLTLEDEHTNVSEDPKDDTVVLVVDIEAHTFTEDTLPSWAVLAVHFLFDELRSSLE